MNAITYRTLLPQDIPAAVELINQVDFGGSLTNDLWQAMETQDHVTCLAWEGQRLAGAIPFTLRNVLIAPGRVVRSAFAHMVSVHADYRNQGLGSKLMNWSLNCLDQYCDLVGVYTGCEGHAPYRFYERCHFYDLAYAYRYDHPVTVNPQTVEINLVPPAEIIRYSMDLSDCFLSCYPDQAGFPRREIGFWKLALNSIIFHQGIEMVGMLTCQAAGILQGYAMLGREANKLKILELATRSANEKVAQDLLIKVNHLADNLNLQQVVIYLTQPAPFTSLLQRSGWTRGMREVIKPDDEQNDDQWMKHFILVGRITNYQRIGQASLQSEDSIDFNIRVWTSQTGGIWLRHAPGVQRLVNLEMKEETLARLLLHRLDLLANIEADLVTVQAGAQDDLLFLQNCFKPCPWLYFDLDYI